MTAADPGAASHRSPLAADDSEELARAEVYGLLAQLFYAPPDDELSRSCRWR